jgi:hypothetical protein
MPGESGVPHQPHFQKILTAFSKKRVCHPDQDCFFRTIVAIYG